MNVLEMALPFSMKSYLSIIIYTHMFGVAKTRLILSNCDEQIAYFVHQCQFA